MDYLADGIFYIECKNQKRISRGIGAVNSLIAIGSEKSILIDPGVWTHQHRILKKLSKRGIIDRSKIKIVCITHQHWDHSTYASFFQNKYGAEVYCHLEEKEALENEDVMLKNFFRGYKFLQTEMENYPLWGAKKAIHLIWGKYKNVKINRTLSDGDKLDLKIPIEVVELPGHTPGNIGFYFSEEKILAAGDLIDLETGIGYDVNSPLSCFETAKESVEKLLKMKINTFISGHGKIVQGEENCKVLFQERIDNSTNLREKIIEVLEKEECTLRKLISKVTQKRSIFEYLFNKYVFYCYLESIDREKDIQFKKRGKKTLMII